MEKVCVIFLSVWIYKILKPLSQSTCFIIITLALDSRREKREHRNGEYLYFVLHKRNMDTTETVTVISHRLGYSNKASMSFAVPHKDDILVT